MRSAPISQALPLDSVASRKASMASSPSTFPHPVSVTAPPGATVPPYTVKTAFTASRNPPKPVTWPVGRTSRTDRMGTPYSSSVHRADHATIAGTSRCGCVISSPAALGSSKPV